MGRLGFFFVFLLLSAGALAQGVQTGTIRGTVRDQQDLAVPGVTVTVTSPSLQGPRTTVTDAAGGYVLRVLPPGDYEVKFELAGFGIDHPEDRRAARTDRRAGRDDAHRRRRRDGAGRRRGAGADRHASRRREHQARGDRGAGDAAHAPGDRAAVARREREHAERAASWSINGAFAFDNVFMINGVDINDNLFASRRTSSSRTRSRKRRC